MRYDSKDISDKVYTHKGIEQLLIAIEHYEKGCFLYKKCVYYICDFQRF